MKFTVTDIGEDFPNPEPGLCRATLHSWIDLGTQHSNNPEYPDKRRFFLVWELDQQRSDGKPFTTTMWINHSPAFHEKSRIRQIAESWRGKPFKPGEAFDPALAVGKSAMLNITINDRGYADVISVNPLPRGTEPLALSEPPLYFDMDEPDSLDKFERVGESIQARITSSPEWHALSRMPPELRPAPSAKAEMLAAAAATPDFDDDLPF